MCLVSWLIGSLVNWLEIQGELQVISFCFLVYSNPSHPNPLAPKGGGICSTYYSLSCILAPKFPLPRL
ncbi:MAG: hypothetical protein XD79_0013 [Atribacteria bacterium 34_128]|jgi:hypothetical protein|nr:MAG: hypothetical protein XD79_0013 [Atribacteria bacterium 34_128]